MKRKIALLTSCERQPVSLKTAINLLRYCADEVAAIIDIRNAGKTAQSVFGLGGGIPVAPDLERAGEVDTLVIGVAPPGGALPAEMRATALQAARSGLRVISGLHEFLSDDPEIREAALESGGELIDLRKNNERLVANRRGFDEGCLRIHTVGHDCNVGKMVVSLELARALNRAGRDAKFVATGQTGILIEGDGCPIDAVTGDFISGAAERLVLDRQHHEILVIEGQGSLIHPRYSGVTLGLLHGCAPHGLILCYEMGRNRVYDMPQCEIPPLSKLIALYELMASVAHPCRVIGVAMNSARFSSEDAARERGRVESELSLPVCDVIRDGPETLVDAALSLRPKILEQAEAASADRST